MLSQTVFFFFLYNMGSLGWAKQVPGVDNDKDALPTWSHHMFLQLFIPKL